MNEIEYDWTTKAGLRAVCLLLRNSHRCGYVGLPKGHPLYGVECNDKAPLLQSKLEALKEMPIGKRGIITVFTWDGKSVSPAILFDVHGGLTYSANSGDYPAAGDEWWLGFDCAHFGDGTMDFRSEGIVRSKQYVIDECESLAEQIAAVCSCDASTAAAS